MKKNFLIAAILTGTLSAAFGIYAATTPVNSDATANLLSRPFKDSNGQRKRWQRTMENPAGEFLGNLVCACVRKCQSYLYCKRSERQRCANRWHWYRQPVEYQRIRQKMKSAIRCMCCRMDGTELSRQLGNKPAACHLRC
jgi:hypothetical protein